MITFEERMIEWNIPKEKIHFYQDSLDHSLRWDNTDWIMGNMRKAKIPLGQALEFKSKIDILKKDSWDCVLESLYGN